MLDLKGVLLRACGYEATGAEAGSAPIPDTGAAGAAGAAGALGV